MPLAVDLVGIYVCVYVLCMRVFLTLLMLACSVLIFLSSFLVFSCRWNLLFSFFFFFCFLCHLLLLSSISKFKQPMTYIWKGRRKEKNEGSWIFIFVGWCWALLRGSLLTHLLLLSLHAITYLHLLVLCHNLLVFVI